MNALEINNLKKSFTIKRKKIEALKDMSFNVEKGKIIGFLGPNGAGKSTTIKSIMGLIKPDSGNIKIFGKDANNIEARKEMGFLPENPSFIDTLTGKDLLMLSASMFKIPKDEAKKRADKLLKSVELDKAASRHIRKYSKGMIQRIGFASAIIHNPKFLILDEPMSGLDPMGRYAFKNMMKEINEKGTSIFFSSHIIPDMEDICDKVIVVKNGKFVKELDKNEIKYFATTGYNIIFKTNNIENFEDLKVMQIDENIFSLKTNKDDIDVFLLKLKEKNAEILDIEPQKKNLEDLFIEMVKFE